MAYPMDDKAATGLRILVVDDEPYICDSLRMLLSIDGNEVVVANGGGEALGLFERGNFDVVITDYSMTGMKGDELAAKLKSRNPRLPVIMITAYLEKLTGENSPLAFVDQIVGKPFRLEEIRQAVARALAGEARV
jgi:CheY-like chemotaxis protein